MGNKPDFYVASDYAGLRAKNASFYYGYEKTACSVCGQFSDNGSSCTIHPDADAEWCFVANFNDQRIVIPFSKLGAKHRDDTAECLMAGIGWILARYRLTL